MVDLFVEFLSYLIIATVTGGFTNNLIIEKWIKIASE